MEDMYGVWRALGGRVSFRRRWVGSYSITQGTQHFEGMNILSFAYVRLREGRPGPWCTLRSTSHMHHGLREMSINYFLAKANLLVLKRVCKSDNNHIVHTVGATIVNNTIVNNTGLVITSREDLAVTETPPPDLRYTRCRIQSVCRTARGLSNGITSHQHPFLCCASLAHGRTVRRLKCWSLP